MPTRLIPTTLAFAIILTVCSIVASISCKKSHADAVTPPQTPIDVSGIVPNSGPDSTIVTVSGSGFSDTASLDTVKFNGVNATVTQATASQLTVIVPLKAGTGNVSVKVGSQTGNGPAFTYDYTVIVTTLAGSGVAGYADGTGTAAEFNQPQGVTTDEAGNVYVMDSKNNRIRRITPAGVVTTLAGSGTAGLVNGQGIDAQFNIPAFATFDTQGNMYITDQENNVIRKMTIAGAVTTLAGNGMEGVADGNAANAEFYGPCGIVIDPAGNVYVADGGNMRIRKITPSGVVSTFAGHAVSGMFPDGSGGIGGYEDGPGSVALFDSPNGMAMDAQGNIYVTDLFNCMVRKITPSDTVSTLAGSVEGEVNGTGTVAQFNFPFGSAIDSLGNIYVSDLLGNTIRKVTPSGVVTTLAGNGTGGFADGIGTAAEFNSPYGVATDTKGNVYVADGSNRIRKISLQ